jgi:hypothetical protein
LAISTGLPWIPPIAEKLHHYRAGRLAPTPQKPGDLLRREERGHAVAEQQQPCDQKDRSSLHGPILLRRCRVRRENLLRVLDWRFISRGRPVARAQVPPEALDPGPSGDGSDSMFAV